MLDTYFILIINDINSNRNSDNWIVLICDLLSGKFCRRKSRASALRHPVHDYTKPVEYNLRGTKRTFQIQISSFLIVTKRFENGILDHVETDFQISWHFSRQGSAIPGKHSQKFFFTLPFSLRALFHKILS